MPREAPAAPVEGAEEFVFCAREGIPAHPLGKSCVAVLLVAHTTKEQDGNHTRYATTCDKRCEASRGAYRNALQNTLSLHRLANLSSSASGRSRRGMRSSPIFSCHARVRWARRWAGVSSAATSTCGTAMGNLSLSQLKPSSETRPLAFCQANARVNSGPFALPPRAGHGVPCFFDCHFFVSATKVRNLSLIHI